MHIPNRKLTEIDCVMTSTTLETIMSYFRACRLYLGYLLVANWWQCHQLPPVCHQFCHQLPPVSRSVPARNTALKNFLSQMIILSYWDIFCLFRALVKVPELSRRFVWFPFKSGSGELVRRIPWDSSISVKKIDLFLLTSIWMV